MLKVCDNAVKAAQNVPAKHKFDLNLQVCCARMQCVILFENLTESEKALFQSEISVLWQKICDYGYRIKS